MTTSPVSGSDFVAVAVMMPSVPAGSGERLTVAVGELFPTVTALDVSGSLDNAPSDALTLTRMTSPRSPLPTVARFRVEAVAPAMSDPFFVHW